MVVPVHRFPGVPVSPGSGFVKKLAGQLMAVRETIFSDIPQLPSRVYLDISSQTRVHGSACIEGSSIGHH